MKYRLLKDLPGLLKDLPGLEKGSILSEYGSGSVLRILVAEEGKTVANFFSNEMFEKFFEEIKEPTDSIHWKPKYDDWYFYISDHGSVCSDIWNDNYTDNKRLAFGFVYRTEEECKAALDRKLAEVRLRLTSDFEPDFKNGKGGWIVFYDHECETLAIFKIGCYDSGEPVHYATREEAEKSIRENEQDWKIYFGIDPSDTDKG